MAEPVQQKFIDAILKQRLLFDGLENRVIIETVRSLQRELVKLKEKLKGIDPGESGLKRAQRERKAERVIKDLEETIEVAFSVIKKRWSDELFKVGGITSEVVTKEIAELLPFNWQTNAISQAQLQSIVEVEPFKGRNLSQWAEHQKETLLNQARTAIRDGATRGATTPEITRQVQGIFNTTKNQASAIVRTSVNHIHNNALVKTYQANSQVIKGVIWWATLDNRTSSICRQGHGTFYTLENSEGVLPAHINCRSVWVPKIKNLNEIHDSFKGVDPNTPGRSTIPFQIRVPNKNWKKDQITRWLKQQGKEIPTVKGKNGKVRTASKEKLLKITDDVVKDFRSQLKGFVPDDIDFHDWLGSQPDFVIRQIYGKRRLSLFKTGKFKLTDFEKRGGGLKSGKMLMNQFGLTDNPLKSDSALLKIISDLESD